MTEHDKVGKAYSLPELREERDTLAKRVMALDNAIKALEHLDGIGGLPLFKVTPLQINVMQSNDFSNLSALKAAVKVLEERGHPMKTPDILKELKSRGKTFSGPDERNSLYASLFKSEGKVVKMGNGLWGLPTWQIISSSNEPQPPVFQQPDAPQE